MYNFTRKQLVDYWINVFDYENANNEPTEWLSSRMSDSELQDCAIYNNVTMQ